MTRDDPVSHTSEWLTGGAPPQDANDETVGEMPWGPTPLPITYAPVRPGERFGPCLLLLPPFADFAPREVGAWDGEDWYALGSGFIVHPSGREFATWLVLWSVIHEDGKPRTTPSGGPEIRFMLLPASQCEIIDTWTVGGLRGTGSHDIAVHDVFVPIAYASGFFDSYVLPEPRYRIPAFCRVIPGLGGMALGIACTAIATLKEQAPRPRCARGRCCAIRRTHRSECRRLRLLCGRLGSFCSTASLSFGQNFWRPAR